MFVDHFLGNRYYDYNEPLAVPDDLLGTVDYILMDPPYLVRSHLLRATRCELVPANDR